MTQFGTMCAEVAAGEASQLYCNRYRFDLLFLQQNVIILLKIEVSWNIDKLEMMKSPLQNHYHLHLHRKVWPSMKFPNHC